MIGNEIDIYLCLKRNGPMNIIELADALDKDEFDIYDSVFSLLDSELIVSNGEMMNKSEMNKYKLRITGNETNFVRESAEILRKVHLLAVKRNNEYKEYRESHEAEVDLNIDEMLNLREQSELCRFLNEQDMQTIRTIQTVMYIGRDYMPETEDEAYERMERRFEDPENSDQYEPAKLESDNPEKLFLDVLAASSGVSEWKDKSIEIDQIDQKMPLDSYLERAFIILGIR